MRHSYKIFQRNPVTLLMLLFFGVVASHESAAQLNPLGAMYYQNQYLANPAMAGSTEGLNLNIGYRMQMTSMSGAPSTQYISGDYLFAEKAAAGLIIYNDKAGLLQSTRIMATYAYHLPLNAEGRKIHMGLSLGIMNERIDTDELTGDFDDPGIARFNSRGAQIDGDFGVAYTDSKLTVQASVPNMKAYLDKEEGDYTNRAVFFGAVSYKLSLSEANAISIEPKVCYRVVKGNDNTVDVGANIAFQNTRLNVFGLYHSTKNATLGIGFAIKNITLTGMYSSAASSLRSSTSGNVEFGLRAALWSKE